MEIEEGVIRRGRTQLNLVPRSSRLTVPKPARTLHFCCHFLVKHKILPNLVIPVTGYGELNVCF